MPIIGNNITGSNDISYLDVQVIFDISTLTPFITVNNLSQGPNLQNVIYWFVVKAPSLTPIHQGAAANPDKTGVWATTIIADPWPAAWKNPIEWSGPPYTFSVFAQDSAGNIYQVNKAVSICRPSGNTNLSLDYFGGGHVELEVNCDGGNIFFQDQTNTSYQGRQGIQNSSVLIVAYPIDETNVPPTPFRQNQFTSALVPITYSSSNYQFTYLSTYRYNFSPTVSVIVTYREQRSFPVLCNIDFGPVVCELTDLMDTLINGSCSDVAGTNQKLIIINTLLNQAMIGVKQPLLGINVPRTLDKINEVGGFKCNCCVPPTAGIKAQTSSVIGNYNFILNGTCGITGDIVPNGNNITFNIAGSQYAFVTSPTIPTQAFTITPGTNGCVTTYTLNISLEVLATDLLEYIASNGYLVNLFNSIVTPQSGQSLVLDGGCLWASGNVFDYVYTLTGIPASGTFAILKSLQIGATSTALTYSFNQANLSGLQTYLNALNVGVFSVSNVGGTVTITSNDNTSALGQLSYAIGSTTSFAGFSSTNTGFTSVSPEFAIQQIINYLCGLNDTQVSTSQEYNVPTIINGASGSIDVAIDEPLNQLLNDFITAQNEVISYVLGLGSVNCSSLSQIFQPNTNLLNANSLLFGTKTVPAQGSNPATQSCAGINLIELFRYMLLNINDPTTNALFCARVNACTVGQVCQAYPNFMVQVVPHNTTCVSIVGISGTFS